MGSETNILPELCLQALPPEVLLTILNFFGEAELWRLRNLCRAFKSAYEDNVRHRFYCLLPHIKAKIETLRLQAENSHFNAERLRLSQACKVLFLRFLYREALMFSAVVWRQSFDQAAWSSTCRAASQVVNEFYAFADHNPHGPWLDIQSIQNRLRTWNVFQTTFTTHIEPFLAEQNALVVPFSTQVIDILDCALHTNWETILKFHSAAKTNGSYSLDCWTRVHNKMMIKPLSPSKMGKRAGDEAPSQKAALLHFLRRSISGNNVAEFNRILEELGKLEATVGQNIPDTMVAEMSQVYALVFEEYPHPWPVLQTTPTGSTYRLSRQFDYNLARWQTLVRLRLRGVKRDHFPLSFWQMGLRDRIGLGGLDGKRTGIQRGRLKRRRCNTLLIETTRHVWRDKVRKSSVIVKDVDEDFRVSSRGCFFKL